ncbi:hypothetical protein CCUS01_06041 [Colletotrichum cuscutae]|uniref:Uncharacterized protein n=1 Tax=Colletotrichum cuscutae TaxID=1209917 RepID=A0AAI9Y0M4_9PEZI|nr:hypothetical protein CCUS01_06041 [Colletotrichum cuscutae]
MGRGQIQLNNGTSPSRPPRGGETVAAAGTAQPSHTWMHTTHTQAPSSLAFWLRKSAAHTVEKCHTRSRPIRGKA